MDYLGEIESLKDQLRFDSRFRDTGYEKIVVIGVGGSGIAGKIFQELYTKKPVITSDDYRVPDFVDKNTLVIGISYSGNTEETLSMVALAKTYRKALSTSLCLNQRTGR